MTSFRQFLEAVYSNKSGCKYWGDSGAGVIPICSTTGRFFVNKRGKEVNEGGSYGLFGGAIFLGRDFARGIKSTDELLQRPQIFESAAIEELREETGYHGPIQLTKLYLFKDERCEFYYQNFAGVVPTEFGSNPDAIHAWEDAGSNWLTFAELSNLEPKHFGLRKLLQESGNELKRLSIKYQPRG